jgi:uncharacterized membrane protein
MKPEIFNWSWGKLPVAIVIGGMIAYAVFFSWFTIARADNYNAGWYDLGIMSQTVWNFGHGHGLTFTNPEAGPNSVHGLQAPRTAIHTDYILALLTPLSWFGKTWVNLLILQALVVAAGAWFVWRLGRKLLGSTWLGVLFASAYLLYPPLQFANLFEFHAVTLAVTFFLAAADAIIHDRWKWFWVWAGLALITKEQVGISLALLAGSLFWRQKQPRRAAWAAGICLAWSVIQLVVVIPLSRPGQSATFVDNKFYFASASTGAGVLSRYLHPVDAVHRLYTPTHVNDLWQLLSPLGLMPVLNPVSYLAIPEMSVYWLSDSPNQQTLFMHYQALAIPFLFIGAMLAWAWLIGRGRRRGKRMTMVVIGGLVVITLAGTANAVWKNSLWPWSKLTRWPLVSWHEHEAAAVKHALALIPAGASVATTQNLGPQVSGREIVKLLPSGASDTEYIMILQRNFGPDTKTNDKRWAEKTMLEELVAWLQRSPAAVSVYHDDRVWLFHRISAPTEPEPVWPAGLLGQ